MVGAIKPYASVMCGSLTLTITDAEGNIVDVRHNHNVINTYAKRKMAEVVFQGSAGTRAIYAYILSGVPAAGPSVSMTLACSGGMPSLNAHALARTPKTLAYGWNNQQNWSVNGSQTFTNGPVSLNGIALCWGPATAPAASISLTGWFAAARFTEWVPVANNVLSIIWVFSLSLTASTVI
jgi:hypothetical protein